MIISIVAAFCVALAGMLVIPGWSFGLHFIPYTFLVSLLIAWGTEMRVITLGVVCAFLFDLIVGAPLGMFPLAFLGATLVMGVFQRVVTLQLVSHDTWSWQDMGIGLIEAALLSVVMMFFMWGVIQLRQEMSYPFRSLLVLAQDANLLGRGFLEMVVFLVIQRGVYRYQQKRSS